MDGGCYFRCSLETSFWYSFNMTEKSVLCSAFSSCEDLVSCYLRCLYLSLSAGSKAVGWGEAWVLFLNTWQLSRTWRTVGSGGELFFLRTRKEVRTPQMKATLRKRMTVEMRKRMKKLMMIFAVSWWMFSKQGTRWYVFTAYLDTDTRRFWVVKDYLIPTSCLSPCSDNPGSHLCMAFEAGGQDLQASCGNKSLILLLLLCLECFSLSSLAWYSLYSCL